MPRGETDAVADDPISDAPSPEVCLVRTIAAAKAAIANSDFADCVQAQGSDVLLRRLPTQKSVLIHRTG